MSGLKLIQESDSREERGLVLKVGSDLILTKDSNGIMRLSGPDLSAYMKLDGSTDFTGAVNNTSQPSCMAYRSTGGNFTVVSGDWRDPGFDGETFDRGSCWDRVTDDRLEVQTGQGGLWFIWWQTSWQTVAGGNWVIMRLVKNEDGTPVVLNAPYFDQGTNAQWNAYNTSWLGILADGDTVSPQVRAANNCVMHNDSDRTYLFAVKLW